MNNDYKYKELTGKIIGAAMQVHRILGGGFQEIIYQRACEIEFATIPLNFKREFVMPIYYQNHELGSRRVDFLVEDKISVELKALTKLEDVDLSQAMNYLEAYNLEIGLLINFGGRSLEFNRLLNRKYKPIIGKSYNLRI